MGSDKKLKKQASVYALTPHAKWLSPNVAFIFFGAILLFMLVAVFMIDMSYEGLRLYYTVVAVGLLCYRLYYYHYKQWLLYFIDLCYVSTYGLLASLWLCPTLHCSTEWQMAVYTVASGAVAGANFPLQTPLALHHPEAFESFFLHASPMWVCYAMRWRILEVTTVPGVFALARNGFMSFYALWVVPYFSFILWQPVLPDCIAGLETLIDCQLRGGMTHEDRLKLKREKYVRVQMENLMATLAHAVLSFSGFLAAAMAYQYYAVQVTWVCCIMITCLDAGYRFYLTSYDPSKTGNTLAFGFKKMALAWVAMIAVYAYCVRTEGYV